MRTNDQGAYYFGRVVQEVLTFYTDNPALFYKDMYDALRELNGKDLIHGYLKLVFNGAHSTRFKDDATGTGKEKMSEYIDKIRLAYWDKYKLDIPPSNEPKINLIGD